MESRSNSDAIVVRQRMRFENPFVLKVGQVFTGFGIGCGVGIGVGRPLNLGAIPALNQVMGATRGATDAFSGVGLAVKPGVLRQIQSSLIQAATKMMMKFGISPTLSLDKGLIPASLQSGMMPSNQNPTGIIKQLATKVPDPTSQSFPAGSSETFASKNPSLSPSYGSRTEEVISSFLQSPLLKDENSELNELVGRLRSENSILQMVLKHQQVIEDLIKENEKLRRILVEDLKIPPSKLQGSYSTSTFPCVDCFECRRKRRKK
ncbi:hypothetical protein Acr_24g0015620 [Actinidia rufa]|uniref:Uncharacterized protein n=1 Tax=Actinidia rufa TaxID=165716 RepID=A0A7J0GX60_9ERIC|nr:hypothetical protein Acr_24g0015620 [Actinidia rufa]